jgi:hypothetical protein
MLLNCFFTLLVMWCNNAERLLYQIIIFFVMKKSAIKILPTNVKCVFLLV